MIDNQETRKLTPLNQNSRPTNGDPHLEETSSFEIKEKEKRRCLNDFLTLGAKLLFCFLLDCSWLRSFGGVPGGGTITISTFQISEFLHVGMNSVWRWSRELVKHGYIWMSKRPLPNARPMNTYHITVFNPSAPKTKFDFGCWGTDGKFRKRKGVPMLQNGVMGDPPVQNTGGNSDAPGTILQIGSSQFPKGSLPGSMVEPPTIQNGASEVPKEDLPGSKIEPPTFQNGTSELPNWSIGVSKMEPPTFQNGISETPKRINLGESPEVIKETKKTKGRGTRPQKAGGNKNKGLKFDPIPDDAWDSKLRFMLEETQKAMARIEADPASWVLVPKTSENSKWLRTEAARLEKSEDQAERDKAAQYIIKAKAIEKKLGTNKTLTEAAEEMIGACIQRIKDIKARLAGMHK